MLVRTGWFAVALAACAFAVASPARAADAPAVAAAPPATPVLRPTALGAPLPTLTLPDLHGHPVALRGLTGPVLVNLWATWCGPCRSEIPALEQLHQQLGPRGLKVVGVAVDELRDEVDMVVGDLNIPYLVLHDPDTALADALRVGTVPASFLYDREGRLVWSHFGAVRAEDAGLQAALARALPPVR